MIQRFVSHATIRTIMSGSQVRPLTALSLLLLIIGAFLAPTAVATVTSPTPACCRASGPHHCSVPKHDGTHLRGQECAYRKPLMFSRSAAPAPITQFVTTVEAHPFLHEFYPELFVPYGAQPASQRAPPERSSS